MHKLQKTPFNVQHPYSFISFVVFLCHIFWNQIISYFLYSKHSLNVLYCFWLWQIAAVQSFETCYLSLFRTDFRKFPLDWLQWESDRLYAGWWRRTPDWGVGAEWGVSLPSQSGCDDAPFCEGLKEEGNRSISPLFWNCPCPARSLLAWCIPHKPGFWNKLPRN